MQKSIDRVSDFNVGALGKGERMPHFKLAMDIKQYVSILISFFILTFFVNINVSFAQKDLGPTRTLFRVDKILIKGIKKVEPEAVLERINIKSGTMITNYTLRQAIEKIYRLKYFETVDANLEEEGGQNVLVFVVKERPIITKIWVKGNDELSDDDITALLKTKEFSILDVNTIKNDVREIQKHYEEKGFFLAQADYELTKEDGNEKSDNLELTYKIKEQQKVKVKNVIFLGNNAFSDEQLKDIMRTKEENLFSFMSDSGSFKEFNFQTDIEILKYFYKTKGYLQVNLATPEITVSEDKKWIFITIKVQEGPQFSVNSISFAGEMLFTGNELLKSMQLKEGDTYSEELMRKDIEALTEKYQDKGYAFANVLRDLKVVPGENKVDVIFSFEKGKMAYFGKIIVKGNTKTRDKVVRRELKIKEGTKFSGSAMRLSKENVNRLGFFDPGSVVFNTVTPQGKDDVLDVEIQVKERNTGQISLGAGYSTATGAFMQASIAQSNFRGLGQNLAFSLSLSSTNQTFNIGFTEPYLFDSQWTAGGDIFRETSEIYRSFDYRRKGFDLRVGHPIFDYTRLFVIYKFEDTYLNEVRDQTIDLSLENGIASTVTTRVVYDKRNNSFEPSAGHYMIGSVEYAGLGGDKKWFETSLDARYYLTVVGDLVFKSRFYASKLSKINNQEIPRTQKYWLGGARNLRGYDTEAIGPKIVGVDPLNPTLTRVYNARGLFSTFASFEFEHPLAREAGLKWVLFFDAGNVYENYIGEEGNYSLKSDYGFGFRWFSPIGVLRFEFGYPINPDPGTDDGMQFFFDIGQLF